MLGAVLSPPEPILLARNKLLSEIRVKLHAGQKPSRWTGRHRQVCTDPYASQFEPRSSSRRTLIHCQETEGVRQSWMRRSTFCQNSHRKKTVEEFRARTYTRNRAGRKAVCVNGGRYFIARYIEAVGFWSWIIYARRTLTFGGCSNICSTTTCWPLGQAVAGVPATWAMSPKPFGDRTWSRSPPLEPAACHQLLEYLTCPWPSDGNLCQDFGPRLLKLAKGNPGIIVEICRRAAAKLGGTGPKIDPQQLWWDRLGEGCRCGKDEG